MNNKYRRTKGFSLSRGNGRILIIFFYLLLGIIVAGCNQFTDSRKISPGNTTYYVNPACGDDANDGLEKVNAWRSFSHINRLSFSPGDRVEITAPGAFYQTLMLAGEGTADDPVEVLFAPGRYDFYADNVFRERYNISNTNDSPDSLKAVGILLKNAKHFEISGKGASIVYCAKMIEICIDSCENILISDLHFDYNRPTVSEFLVVDTGEDYADLQIHKDSDYEIIDGQLIWKGDGWSYSTNLLGQDLDMETNEVRRVPDPLKNMKFEEIRPLMVRAKGKHKLNKGHIYQLRNPFRDYAAVFTRRSKNITWESVDFHFLHGMGLVSQFSENLTYNSVSVAPDCYSGRTTSAWADCLHISGCKGRIIVNNCLFSGAHDDAINIHGTYLRVVEKISDKQLKLKFMHKQTYGFLAVNPGDEIEFINHESYKSYGLNKVKEAQLLNPEEIVITLEESIPGELRLKDVIENVTWTPEVEIRGCNVFRIPTRGFLLSTRKKVIVENNEFLTTHMSAILMAVDANNWYESGWVRDVTIRNNKFISCAEPVIYINPENSLPNNELYQNIRIDNNEFILRNEVAVKAKSTRNLSFKGNNIYAGKRLNDEIAVVTNNCADVDIDNNNYLIK